MLLAIRSEDRGNGIVSNAVGNRRQRRQIRRALLPKSEKVFLAVHRADDSVYFKELDVEAFSVLCALRDGKHLSEAVDCTDWSARTGEEAAENVQAWFALWSSLGWFCKSS
jgi:hypothetical protein